MANGSVDFLADKPSALSPRSTNHKEDIIKGYLHELKIAYKVMAGHPDVLSEFICAVKGGANLPAPEPTAPVLKNLLNQNDYRATHR
jgi:hypothetical protein